ncbi:CPBP family intramembrane glutamic endopeptidase [Aquimarina sp. 2201CG5-10]|uniref:CPBP family intramembrane glutamic endopeptidase n=1 Tax=Aquimarina callyspongiae TaxID=3098150 RepID=UPI002AB5546C|nr:CPBP family intramembrane glutamic endopeptidase [Aquimarina sp. 2201CG5-10]MDY8135965.1 CPBP family intramembrane glutamic endopeptidase [Aquimarina sp. 2201CG5-10]
MKNKIYTALTKKYIVILTMLLTPLFGFIDRNFVFFSALTVAFFILWSSNFQWSYFGFEKKITVKTVIRSFIIAILLFFVFYTIEAFLEIYFGKIDISSLDDLRGNIVGYIVTMIIVWVFAAFGEEFLFRGFYMKRLAVLFGDSNKAWLFSAVIISIYFGISHMYQGPAGVIGVTLWHFCVSMIFYKDRKNLISAVLIHGFYDAIGLTLLYFSKERIIYDFITQII